MYLVSTFNPRNCAIFFQNILHLCTRVVTYRDVHWWKTRQCILKIMSRNREAARVPRSPFASPCSFNARDMPDRLHYRCLSHNVSLTYTKCIFLSTALESHRIPDVIVVRALLWSLIGYDPHIFFTSVRGYRHEWRSCGEKSSKS